MKTPASRGNSTLKGPPDDEKYMGIVYRLAHKYDKFPTNGRCDFEDYVSAGMAALNMARRSFNPTLKTKFSTYAFPFIKNAIEKEYQGIANAVSGATPYHVNNTEGVREEISFINNTMVSLTGPVDDDGKPYPSRPQPANAAQKQIKPQLKELIVASGKGDPAANAERNEIIETIDTIIDSLDKDDRDIIYRRMFAGDTFQQIADAKDLSWRAVHLKFGNLKKKLRMKFEEAGLDEYA